MRASTCGASGGSISSAAPLEVWPRTSSAMRARRPFTKRPDVLRGEAGRQLDGLGQHHACGHVGAGDQLRRAHPQGGPVKRGHPGERPAVGEALQEVVDPGAVLVHGLHERSGEVIRGDRQIGEHLGACEPLGFSLVEKAEGTLTSRSPNGGEGLAQASVTYSPERVSTLMRSPGFTNRGTWSTRPVSSVAGLRAPDTRSPCTPGSVSATFSSTAAGRSDPTISSPYIWSVTDEPSTM